LKPALAGVLTRNYERPPKRKSGRSEGLSADLRFRAERESHLPEKQGS